MIIPEGVRSLINDGPVDHSETHSDPFAVIGISLVLGFIFMLLVDQVSNFMYCFFRCYIVFFRFRRAKTRI